MFITYDLFLGIRSCKFSDLIKNLWFLVVSKAKLLKVFIIKKNFDSSTNEAFSFVNLIFYIKAFLTL